MAYDVFISYCAEDKLIADAVCNVLEGRKIRCWIAPRDVPAGANWGGAIIDAINETKVMVVVFSSRANKSPQVFREIERAVNNGDTIIPFRVEDVVPSKDLEFFISACHWLDAMSPPMEAHLAKLADRVSSLLNLQSDTTPSAVFSPIARPPRAVPGNLSVPSYCWMRSAVALEKVITAINQADVSEREKNEVKSLLRKLLGSKAAASVLGPGAQSLADKYFAG
jgi:hypothetical protein